jgi:glycosyltransferase involved in cell wall biosynthesis
MVATVAADQEWKSSLMPRDNAVKRTSVTDATDVAIVLVEPEGAPLTTHTLEVLRSLTPAGARIVVARSATAPGLPLGITEHGLPTQTSPERARNLVLRDTPEAYAAFLNPRVQVYPGWLDEALTLLDHREELSCVSLGIEGQPGQRVSVTCWPNPTAAPVLRRAPLLYAPLDAMVVRSGHFRAIGGFDERLVGGGSDFDLGWRLWLAGGSVAQTPSALLRLEGEAEIAEPAAPLSDRYRNSLATLFKCYDDDHMNRALPAALVSVPHELDASATRMAIAGFRAWLPDLRNDRRTVQAGRRRADSEILPMFDQAIDTFLETVEGGSDVSVGFDLQQAFGARRKVLVVTGDVLTEKMAGPAIRAWQICETLSVEHDVHLVTTASLCRITSDRFSVEAADLKRLEALEQWCDVIVLQGFVLLHAPALRSTTKVMVVDMYDPIHLETLEMSKRDADGPRATQVRTAVDTLNEQLGRGDYFICASSKQRDFWLGQLSALGRVNPQNYDADPMLRKLIDVVPFGLPDQDPKVSRKAIKGVVPGIGAEDEVILWGGGIYNWFDPLVLIKAIDRLRQNRPNVRLFFMGVRHPNPEVPEMKMSIDARTLADELGLTNKYVFFNDGWVSYEDRQNYLLDADIGVSTHLEHAETAFSFRTRILDYLWAGLPIVATSGDGFADIIEAEQLGLVVPPENVESLERALAQLLEDKEFAAVCRKNVDEIRGTFIWSLVLRPLTDFCRSPRRAPDLIHLGGVNPSPSPKAAARWQQDARIVLALYEDGGARLVIRGARQRLRRRLMKKQQYL